MSCSKLPEVTFGDLMKAARRCDIELSLKFDSSYETEKCLMDGWYASGGDIWIKDTPKNNNIILTLIHELLHHLHPDLSESQVGKMSRGIYCDLTTAQVWRLEAQVPGFNTHRTEFRIKNVNFINRETIFETNQ